MKIAFLVSSLQNLQADKSTALLAFTARKMSCEIVFIELGDFIYQADGQVMVEAMQCSQNNFQSPASLLKALRETEKQTLAMDELDVLWLRYNPEESREISRWGLEAAKIFSHIAAKKGVLVLNEPSTHLYTTNKMYLQEFPPEVRLPTLISRNKERIREFYEEQGKKMVLKPLMEGEGAEIFYLDKKTGNFNQMVDAMSREGYIVAQPYIDSGKSGNLVILIMNAQPLQYADQTCAALLKEGEWQKPGKRQLNEALSLLQKISPRLEQDGIFLASVEIYENKLMAVNTMSDEVLNRASELLDTPFAEAIIEAIKVKQKVKQLYPLQMSNKELAILSIK